MILPTLYPIILSAQQFFVQSLSYNLLLLITIGSVIRFRTKNINFFNPDFDKATEIKNSDKLYYNVHSFTQKIRAINSLKLKHNLKIYLLNKINI